MVYPRRCGGTVNSASEKCGESITIISSKLSVIVDASTNVVYKLHMFETRQTAHFAKWLHTLPAPAAREIAIRIARLEAGLMGDVQPVGAAVSELRIHYGPGYRVYFTRIGKTVFLLLAGGDKSSQAKDIHTAQEMARAIRKG